jgi:hypothetical protein
MALGSHLVISISPTSPHASTICDHREPTASWFLSLFFAKEKIAELVSALSSTLDGRESSVGAARPAGYRYAKLGLRRDGVATKNVENSSYVTSPPSETPRDLADFQSSEGKERGNWTWIQFLDPGVQAYAFTFG